MNTAEVDRLSVGELGNETVVHLPSGLLGFEQIKKYVLVSDPAEEPFKWLQVPGDSSLAFLVISPFQAVPDYTPEIPDEDVRSIGLEDPQDALVLNIVTLRKNGRSTLNLKGPIVINRFSMIGKQVVIANAAEYSVQHPLPPAE
jgi:flagellar assembly factor FliW